MSDTGDQHALEPTRLPDAKPAADLPAIEVRGGKIDLGRHGWCGPDDMMERVREFFDLASGLAKPADGQRPPMVFSRLALLMEFGLTRKEWAALAKMPEWKRSCDMVDTMAEAWMEAKLAESSGRNPAGIIFALKNSHDWRDQPESPVEDAIAKMMGAVMRLPQKFPAPVAELSEGT